MKKIVMLFIMLFVFTSVVFAGGIDVPKLERRVMDTANIFDKNGVDKLTVALKEIEKQGIQMAILTVPSLNGEPIEDFSRRVVREWKLGEKGKDNGLLITISKGDRKWRVETGRGIQGALTDGVTKSIMTNKFIPQAKAGNFANGLLLATKEMSDRYVSSLVPLKSVVTTTVNSNNEESLPLGFKVFLIIGVLIIGVCGIIVWRYNKNLEEEDKRQKENFEKYMKLRKKEMGFVTVPRTERSYPSIAPIPVPIYIPDPEPVYHRPEPSRNSRDDDEDDRHSSSSSSSDSDSGFGGGGGSFDGGGSSGDF